MTCDACPAMEEHHVEYTNGNRGKLCSKCKASLANTIENSKPVFYKMPTPVGDVGARGLCLTSRQKAWRELQKLDTGDF